MQTGKIPRQKKSNFPRWLPVTASLVLMIVVAAVAATTMKGLKRATYWRQHTFQTILAVQLFQDNLLDIQRGMRGYVVTGDTNALVQYQNGIKHEQPMFDRLADLTRDNRARQRSLKSLAEAVKDILAYDTRLIDAYQRGGPAAARRADNNQAARLITGRALDVLKAFSDEEQKLLDVLDAAEQADYRGAGRLLVFGSVLAAVLLVVANLMASRELTFRRRVEAKLNQTLLLQNAILNSADYAIVSTDPKGIVQTFNPAAEQLLGYSAGEIVGKATPMLWRDPKEVAERAEKLSRKLGLPVRPTFETIAMKVQFDEVDEGEWTFIRKDGSRFISSLVVTALASETGGFTGFLGIFRDISQRKQHEAEREKLILELQTALAQIKTLSGLIPICGWCKSVRSDQGFWQTVEQYVRSNTGATFSHGICPSCTEKFKADIFKTSTRPDAPPPPA